MKRTVFMSLFIVSTFAPVTGFSAGESHWTYSGDTGPEHWGELDPSYSACATGKNQSPIDLSGMVEGELPAVKPAYKAGGKEVVNNGHSIQVNYEPGSRITLQGHEFELQQFHFHSPSENTIDGKSYPMEAHFVHADSDGNLAVIAVMFTVGEKNTELEKVWRRMPGQAGDTKALPSLVDGMRLLPEDLDYYRFNGSLTTPPCSEGVTWLVIKASNTASISQIEQFTHTMGHPNNRPLQAANARLVIK